MKESDRNGRHNKTKIEYHPGKDIRLISFAELVEQSGEMFLNHYQEIETNNALADFGLDTDTYEAIEKAGALFILGVYITGLIGYSVNTLSYHPHARTLRICTNDVIYLKPEHRSGRLGLKLIDKTEQIAKEEGARLMSWNTRPGTSFQKLMVARSYTEDGIIYSKEI